MTHELAKELEVAGFPFIEGLQGYRRPPTLSELIEACVHAPVAFVDKKTNHWVGTKRFSLLWGLDEGFEAAAWDGITNHIGIGQDPEEAVARLWLALNPSPVEKK